MRNLIKKILREEYNDFNYLLIDKVNQALKPFNEKIKFDITVNDEQSIRVNIKNSDYFFKCLIEDSLSEIINNYIKNFFLSRDDYENFGKFKEKKFNSGYKELLSSKYYNSIIPPREVRSYVYNENIKLKNNFFSNFPELKDKVHIEVEYGKCIKDLKVLISYPKTYYYDYEPYSEESTKTDRYFNKEKLREVKTHIKKYFNNLSFKDIILIKPDSPQESKYGNRFHHYKEEKFKDYYKTKEELFNEFLILAKNTYGDIYEYNINHYTDNITKTKVYCKKHKSFFDVTPKEHIRGKRCPFDNESKGENLVRVILEKNNIPYLQYHKMKGCFIKRNDRCFLLTFDFYLPKHNVVIEYDGRQHFEPVDYFGGEETHQRQVMLDSIKNNFCKNSNIKIIRIPYHTKDNDIEDIILNNLKRG